MSGFRHLGDRLVHQGRIWHVAVARFAAPDGEAFERDVVRSPGAVGVVPVRHDAAGVPHVILVRQYRGPFDELVVEVPAGMRDIPGEPTAATAARELAEEVGLAAADYHHLLDIYPSAGMTDAVVTLYLATGLSPVARDTHGPEEAHMDVLEVPLAAAVDMVLSGQIRDSKTVIGLLLIERRLRVSGAVR
jgi:ADP-ribose pyrophosphatase